MRNKWMSVCPWSFLAGVVLSVSCATPSIAESNRWSGAYGGVHGGYGAAASTDQVGVRNFSTNAFVDNYGALRPKGPFGGAQIGYNVLNNKVLLGVEADLSGGKITAASSDARSGLAVAAKSDLNAMSTLRGKLGFAVDPSAIVYVTGGLAVGRYDYQIGYSGNLNGTLHQANFALGWTAGFGAEVAIDRNWSVKAEYLYANFMKAHTINDGTISTIVHLQQSNLRLGLNYKF